MLTKILLILAALTPPPLFQSRPIPDRTWTPSNRPEIVYIDLGFGACSGSIIGEGIVATAAHCTQGLSEVGVRFEGVDGQFIWRRFKVAYVGLPGSDHDVSILKGDTMGITPLELAEAMPQSPAACQFYGYAGTDTEMQMPCFVMENVNVMGWMGLGESRPGDSGGVVLGRDGKVIGIVWGGLVADPTVFIIAPVEAIRFALENI